MHFRNYLCIMMNEIAIGNMENHQKYNKSCTGFLHSGKVGLTVGEDNLSSTISQTASVERILE